MMHLDIENIGSDDLKIQYGFRCRFEEQPEEVVIADECTSKIQALLCVLYHKCIKRSCDTNLIQKLLKANQKLSWINLIDDHESKRLFNLMSQLLEFDRKTSFKGQSMGRDEVCSAYKAFVKSRIRELQEAIKNAVSVLDELTKSSADTDKLKIVSDQKVQIRMYQVELNAYKEEKTFLNKLFSFHKRFA